jgi:hypothetical protein
MTTAAPRCGPPTACILCECNCGIEIQLGGEDRDWLAGTPWHKHVPARIEAL